MRYLGATRAAACGGVVEQELRRAPDTLLCAARVLGVEPEAAAAVFEDPLAGVGAGRAGRYEYVVRVD